MPVEHLPFSGIAGHATLRVRFIVRVLADMPRWLWLLIAALLIGCAGLPVAIYMVGQRWVAPYEGARGLASFFSAIYGDAKVGNPLALLLLFGPALLLATCKMLGSIWTATNREGPATR